MKSTFALLIALTTVAACQTTGTLSSGGFIRELPEGVLEIADPSQDLTAVTLREEDGCYWYRHVGPVETTLLPLRNKEGRPICTRAQT
ncbi:hypothetical protein N6L24_11010 [Cognatishimia sp. SS12]|uniref:hypothetical protein n=1 Tax=Cognatishimia sp. SS12 TaxID=2979465 RepID=UPI002330DAF3|nr:hypothetical protein [Cognatishimia sp. SS12]MDC0738812.1 hypothetical protein [Cognatishimia sp. SS12]